MNTSKLSTDVYIAYRCSYFTAHVLIEICVNGPNWAVARPGQAGCTAEKVNLLSVGYQASCLVTHGK